MSGKLVLICWAAYDTPRDTPIRDTLKLSNIPFEEKKVEKEEWTTMKPSTPFGGIPMLQIDDQIISQSSSILRYVGKLGGLYPEDPYNALLVDEIIDAAEDLLGTKIAPAINFPDEEKRKSLMQELCSIIVPSWLSQIEKVLERNGSKEHTFVVGNKATIGDLKLWKMIDFLTSGFFQEIPKNVLDNYPLIQSHYTAALEYFTQDIKN